MLELNTRKVWLYREHIDFRKQLNGLVQLIIEEKDRRPNDGAVYVFRNRQRNKVKLLLWHRNGFFLGYKRLERGKFDFPTDADVVEIDAEALRELILGMPMVYRGKAQAEKTVFS
jgi:transposase